MRSNVLKIVVASIATALVCGLFGHVAYEEEGEQKALTMAFVIGGIMGAAMAGYLLVRARFVRKRLLTRLTLHEAEGLVHHGPAKIPTATDTTLFLAMLGSISAMQRLAGIGGYLVLTKRYLAFEPDALEGQKSSALSLDDVQAVHPVPGSTKKLALVTKKKQIVQISVTNRAQWIAKLKSALPSQPTAQ